MSQVYPHPPRQGFLHAPPEGSERPALGTSGDPPTPPSDQGFRGATDDEKRRTGRASRHALKATQRQLTPSRSSRYCWFPAEANVHVEVGRAGIAHTSQIHRCGSPWSCPVCSPLIRAARGADIDQGVNGWLTAGHGALFVTLTVRHHAHDALEARLAAMARALWDCLKGAPWDRRAALLGYVGAIRALEVTWGQENGWHPHCHAILLFERPPTAEEVADLRTWLRGRWSSVVERRGFGTLSAAHGVDVRAVTAEGIGDYVTKVEGGWTAGAELVRGDLKTGHGRLTPFELLGHAAIYGDARAAHLWQEYEAATFGKRAIVWSRGLRRRLIPEAPEASDAELAAAEGGDSTCYLALVNRMLWKSHLKRATVGLLLDRIEDDALVLIGAGIASEDAPVTVTYGEAQAPPSGVER